jgi:hypothetical protein
MLSTKHYYFLIVLVLLLLILGCSAQIQSDKNPEWLNALIEKLEKEPAGNPPQSIWQCEYEGKTVYYNPPQCCDQYSILYDNNGKIICAPDGGKAGKGDNKCPDFFNKRKNVKLIWKDSLH